MRIPHNSLLMKPHMGKIHPFTGIQKAINLFSWNRGLCIPVFINIMCTKISSMQISLFNARERGHTQVGWLDSWHSFSFGSFYNSRLTGFGKLRVLNDDKVAPGAGFGLHPHENMEIVSIPLQGALAHRDSTGRSGVIKEGDVQLMSAGTGISHSEMNASTREPVKFLQIWVFPEKMNIEPRYDQRRFLEEERMEKLQTVVDPAGKEGLKINQQAWFHLYKTNRDAELDYSLRNAGNGLFLFVIEGGVQIDGIRAGERDALGIQQFESLSAEVEKGSELLLIEIPLQ